MKPKTKRKLKWVADSYTSGDYVIYRSAAEVGVWIAFVQGNPIWQERVKTKRQAIAACERHAREKGRK